MADWTGKTAFVTGAASGIGRALAQDLARRGARVAVSDIDAEGAHTVAGALPGGPHGAFPCDVTDGEAVRAVMGDAQGALGPLALAAANAGVVVPGALADQPDADMRWIFNVNVFGTLHVARAAIALFRQAGRRGHILLTGSENSLSLPAAVAPLHMGAYNASKHAVLSLADVLRTECAPDGIGVSLLCPGPVPSNLITAIRRRDAAHGGPGALPRQEIDPGVLETLASQTLEAETVAARTIDGVEAGTFYILTHPHMRADVERRYAEILAAMPNP